MSRLLNQLSVPRANFLYVRKKLSATCQATDAVGHCVYFDGDIASDLYSVTKADPAVPTKMPAIGVIIEKPTATTCVVQTGGRLPGIVTGFTAGDIAYVGTDGFLTQTPPGTYPQVMGVASDDEEILLSPEYSEAGGGDAGPTVEVDFYNELFVTVTHNRGWMPLVQVMTKSLDGWNVGGWNDIAWNGGFGTLQKIEEIDLRHLGRNAFLVSFTEPTSGKVLYR